MANPKPWFNHALYRMTARVEKVFKNLESIFNQWFEDGCGHVQFTALSCSRTIMSCGRTLPITCTHRLDDSGGTQTERWWPTTLDSDKMQTTLGGHARFPTCAALINHEGQVR